MGSLFREEVVYIETIKYYDMGKYPKLVGVIIMNELCDILPDGIATQDEEGRRIVS